MMRSNFSPSATKKLQKMNFSHPSTPYHGRSMVISVEPYDPPYHGHSMVILVEPYDPPYVISVDPYDPPYPGHSMIIS